MSSFKRCKRETHVLERETGYTQVTHPRLSQQGQPTLASSCFSSMQDLLFPHQEGHGGQLSTFGQSPAAPLPVELWLWLGGSGSCDKSLLPSRLCPVSPNPSSHLQILTWLLPFSLFQPEETIIQLGLTLKRSFLNSTRRGRGRIVEKFKGESQKVLKKCTFSEENKDGK